MTRRRQKVAAAPGSPAPGLFAADEDVAAQIGERLRRIALGMTAALLTARAYFPGEDAATGSGLLWVLALFLAAGIAVIASWTGGITRIRWSWVDAAFLALVALVGLSAAAAADRRPAIALAWEWVGLALAYLLLRSLPRTRDEASALAGALLATAVALAAYGLYQVSVEFPVLKQRYLADPASYLAQLGIDSNSPSRKALEDRLLGSQEPIATFALTNSLAGFLVGPAVMAFGLTLEDIHRRKGRESKVATLLLAAAPWLTLLACLLLTKSRSAYLGLLAGLAVLAWRERRRVPKRMLALAVAAVAGVFVALVVIGTAAHQLDWQVLTQSTKSLRYRAEFWTATWNLIRGSPRVFGAGLGPGNFAGPYHRYKLPQASEEIIDPHNMLLEVWVTAGVIALIALLATLALALREALGPARGDPQPQGRRRELTAPEVGDDRAPAPARAGWLWVCSGGGWLVVVALGKLNPFEGEGLARWVVLGVGWFGAAVLLGPLARRGPIAAAALGAGALAVMVNLLAAGGIGMPPVALGLWTLVALGQDLRDDRPCGRLRVLGGRWCAFGLAVGLAALIGSFVGSNGPHWRAQAEISEADEALTTNRFDFNRARDAYVRAAQADHYWARPWSGLANLRFRKWQSEGAPPGQRVWREIAPALDQAVSPPRDPNSLSIERQRIAILHELIRRQGPANKDYAQMCNDLVNAAARAVVLYPNNAPLHAELAEASAAVGRADIAAREAREALRLDSLNPHQEKKLANTLGEPVLKWLRERAAPENLRK